MITSLHTLVYISTATEHFNEKDLEAILLISRKNNAAMDISGMLVYGDGNFIQVLEGPKEAIYSLYAKIKMNPAHQGFITLLDQPIEKRIFAEWSMAYKSLTNYEYKELDGYINTRRNNLDELGSSNSITKILKDFITNNQ